jgi:hydrogenase nickel incorporation protein HypA/HybF
MHELAITQEIVEAVLERAEQAGGRRVARVVIAIGQLTAVLPAAVRFCFELCAEDTLLAGAALIIEQPPGTARCRRCDAQVTLADLLGLCDCGSNDLAWLSGHELQIRELEMI